MTRSDQRLNRQPSMQVLETIAEAEGTDPEQLTPLYSAIDPDALDALIDVRGTSQTGVDRVVFSYEGYTVTVTGDGRVDVASESV